jgi:hypothetical protein
MTEQEAMNKWCPFARAAEGTDTTAVTRNRDSWGNPQSDCRCLATRCMAWRVNPHGDGYGSCGLVPEAS